MLKLFRKKQVTKVVLWGILILILPAFVIWGSGSLGRSREKGPTYVGLIDNKKVKFEDFAGSLAGIRCQIVLNYFNQPKMLDLFLRNKPFMGKMAWDRLIMLREVSRYKIKVLDKDVVNYIRSHPIFARGGLFDERIYQYILKNNMALDPRTFEEIVREHLALQRLNEFLTKDIIVSDEEVLEDYRRENEKFKIAYVMFPSSDFLAKVKIGETEVKDYYQKHKEEFLLPPKEGEAEKSVSQAKFEDVKESINSFLAERAARKIAGDFAQEEYKKISELMTKDKDTFAGAAVKLGLEVRQTPLFSKPDYLDGIGEAERLVNVAVKLKKGNVADGPVETRRGALIVSLVETQGLDEEKFKSQKSEYSKKVLENKKDAFLERWLRRLELATSLNIDLREYDKYYR